MFTVQTSPMLTTTTGGTGKLTYNSACAAAGQLGLMSLYETMFSQFDITVSQLLVTSFDFTSPERRRNIQHVLSQLLALGIVPLLNENDAVSGNQGYNTFGRMFADNDSLASLVAVEMSAQLLILLTDVKGVYDRPPSEPGSKVIDIFNEETAFKVGDKSLQGRGGMGAKVDAALSAVKGGVQAVVIAAGHDSSTIGQIIDGQQVGTLFLPNETAAEVSSAGPSSTSPRNATDGVVEADKSDKMDLVHLAQAARAGGRELSCADPKVRSDILLALAASLQSNTQQILDANKTDIANAEKR